MKLLTLDKVFIVFRTQGRKQSLLSRGENSEDSCISDMAQVEDKGAEEAGQPREARRFHLTAL